ncbi:hypothetical protein ADL27_46410, partial [Streptomyces sp. NRRL F-6602]
NAWSDGRFQGKALPDADAPSAKLAGFFASLSRAQRLDLAERYPLAVGNMNGAPPKLRYRANRIALEEAVGVERERVRDHRLSTEGRQEADRRMHRFLSLLHPKRHVLAFDPTGRGRVAEVFGNLDRAARVSVVVPGVDTDVLTYERTYRTFSAPAGMAKSLYKAERAQREGSLPRSASGAPRVAVIAWADYTSPAGIGVDAVTAKRAEDGAVRLSNLVRSLPGKKSVALYCHSYGSVVCGVSARDLPSRVTDIAVAGSPGMRAANAAQLGTGARIWAMRDQDDWIGEIPNLELAGVGHGTDPVSAEFGARVLSANGAAGHAGYFEPGTESLDNFARIGVGAYQ